MSRKILNKIISFTASIVLAAQYGNHTLYAEENTSADTVSQTASEQTESDDSICRDYVLPVGYMIPLDIMSKGTITTSDPKKVLFANLTGSKFNETCRTQSASLIYGVSTGETEYQLTDDNGNILGKGTIKIVPDSETICDEPLIKDNDEIVQIVNIADSKNKTYYAYIRYDDGSLYTYNKQGNGRLTLEDNNVAAVTQTNNQITVVYYNDGSFKINGEKADADYTVVTVSAYNSIFLGSDGVVRRITGDNEGYKISELFGNVKAITNDFSDVIDIIQTNDGKTLISCYSSGGFWFTDTGLKITPKKLYTIDAMTAVIDNRTILKGKFYVSDIDNNLYEIISDIDTSDKTEHPAVKTRLISSENKEIGYLHTKSGSSEAILAYTDKDGKNFTLPDGKPYDEEGAFVSQYPPYSRILPYYTTENSAGGLILINNMKEYCVSYLDEDDTVRLSFGNNFGALTNVMQTNGCYFDGCDYKILIIRKDNTLWSYNINTAEFEMLHPENVPEPLGPRYGAADLVTMMRYLCGMDDGTDSDWLDLNGDGKVNVLDFILMKKEILAHM